MKKKEWLAFFSIVGCVFTVLSAAIFVSAAIDNISAHIFSVLILIGSGLLFLGQDVALISFRRWPPELGAISLLAGIMWIAILVNMPISEILEFDLVIGSFILFYIVGNICVFIATGVNSSVDR